MTDVDERWAQVGQAIAARIAELSLTLAEVIRSSGVSDKTLRRYIAGEPIVRLDKRREICIGLNWLPDSIDRILDGKQPVKLEDLAVVQQRLAERDSARAAYDAAVALVMSAVSRRDEAVNSGPVNPELDTAIVRAEVTSSQAAAEFHAAEGRLQTALVRTYGYYEQNVEVGAATTYETGLPLGPPIVGSRQPELIVTKDFDRLLERLAAVEERDRVREALVTQVTNAIQQDPDRVLIVDVEDIEVDPDDGSLNIDTTHRHWKLHGVGDKAFVVIRGTQGELQELADRALEGERRAAEAES